MGDSIYKVFLVWVSLLLAQNSFATDYPKASQLILWGHNSRVSYMVSELGVYPSPQQIKNYENLLNEQIRLGDPPEGAYIALVAFVDLQTLNFTARQREDARKLLNQTRAELFGCLRETVFKSEKSGDTSVLSVLNQLMSLENNWDDHLKISKATKNCVKQLESLNNQSDLLRIKKELNSVQPSSKNYKGIAFVRSLLNPRLVACKEFGVTEVIEEKNPWRWGIASCVREDGLKWVEGFKGHSKVEYEMQDAFASAIGGLLGETDSEKGQEKEQVKGWNDILIDGALTVLFGPELPQAGSFFSIGVKYRWSDPVAEGQETSTSELEYVTFILGQEAHYTSIRDKRFEDLLGESITYQVIHMGYAPPLITSLSESRGFVYENQHKRFFITGQNPAVLAERYLNPSFKFLPFGIVKQ